MLALKTENDIYKQHLQGDIYWRIIDRSEVFGVQQFQLLDLINRNKQNILIFWV